MQTISSGAGSSKEHAQPGKGARRALDERWLALLRREDISSFLEGTPEPPQGMGLAIQEFNEGDYWRCHETLEGLWLAEGYPLRLFYHALIKAAVGLLHLRRHNRRGAMAKLRDSENGLVPFLPVFMGVDTARLRLELVERLECLQTDAIVDWKAVDGLPHVKVHLS